MKTLFFYVSIFFFTSTAFSQSGWIFQNSNVSKNLNDVFFVNAQTGWIVGDSSRMLKTTNGGLNWSYQTLPYYSHLKTIFFINENTGWAAGGFYYIAHFGAMFKTTNGGNNWISSPSKDITDIFFINENTGFQSYDASGDFVTAGGISRTTNTGLNWGSSFYSSYVINSLSFNDSTGFAIGNYYDDTSHDTSIIIKTTDFGNTWERKYIESNNNWSNGLKQIFFKNNFGWAIGYAGSVLKSTDEGESWTKILNSPGNFNSVFFINENTGWIAGSGGKIMKSTDGGLNWFFLNNTYSNGLNSVFFVNENTGWTVGNTYPTGNGIILRTITGGVTSVNQAVTSLPDDFILEQNYPNPFNPLTVISYRIAVKSFIELKFYNVLGVKIATLVNENQNEGNYDVHFDAGGLSSGIYYYSLYANGESKGIRMMALIR